MQTEVTTSFEHQREAAQHPLTLAEKKALVKDVQKLITVQEHLDTVVYILKENDIDTTVEVDFESMPTHVQRRLQAFVAENSAGARKGAAAPAAKKQPPVKKKAVAPARKPAAAPAAAASSSSAAGGYAYNPELTQSMAVGVESLTHLGEMDADADGDVLLFPTEDFDELRADGAGDGSDASDHEGGGGGDDDVQFPVNDDE